MAKKQDKSIRLRVIKRAIWPFGFLNVGEEFDCKGHPDGANPDHADFATAEQMAAQLVRQGACEYVNAKPAD